MSENSRSTLLIKLYCMLTTLSFCPPFFLNYHGQSANRMLSNLDQAFQNTTWPWSVLQEAVLLKPRVLLTGESYPYMSAQSTTTIVRKTLY